MKKNIIALTKIYLIVCVVLTFVFSFQLMKLFENKTIKDCDVTGINSAFHYIVAVATYIPFKIGCELARPRFNLDNQTK